MKSVHGGALSFTGEVFLKKIRINWNIGTVIFGALFVYLIIMIVVYLLTDHVSSYMVTNGTLSRNNTYTAMAIRQEQIVRSPADGYVNYYVLDSSKAGKGTVVCSITGTKSELTTVRLSDADLSAVRKLTSRFLHTYSSDDYQSVYDLKYAINSSVVNNSETGKISGMTSEAPVDGLVTFYMDGQETLLAADITKSDFKSSARQSKQLRTEDEVAAGDPIYRIISSERWAIVFPISDKQYAELSSRNTVRVRFAKDGNTETGDLTLFDSDGAHFAQVSFYSGMVRYCDDRYLDIELVTNNSNGLKLPLSSIVQKEFYVIPESYLSSGGEANEAGFLVQTRKEDGTRTTVFIEAELYEKTKLPEGNDVTEEYVYFVDPQVFHRGDIIIRPNSQSTYTIGEKYSLEGVYCTNRGYAVFRKIELLDQNEDYCIVKNGTPYGLSQYDYIVRDGRDVKEEQIVTAVR